MSADKPTPATPDEPSPEQEEQALEEELEAVWQDESPETARETLTADEVDGNVSDE